MFTTTMPKKPRNKKARIAYAQALQAEPILHQREFPIRRTRVLSTPSSTLPEPAKLLRQETLTQMMDLTPDFLQIPVVSPHVAKINKRKRSLELDVNDKAEEESTAKDRRKRRKREKKLAKKEAAEAEKEKEKKKEHYTQTLTQAGFVTSSNYEMGLGDDDNLQIDVDDSTLSLYGSSTPIGDNENPEEENINSDSQLLAISSPKQRQISQVQPSQPLSQLDPPLPETPRKVFEIPSSETPVTPFSEPDSSPTPQASSASSVGPVSCLKLPGLKVRDTYEASSTDFESLGTERSTPKSSSPKVVRFAPTPVYVVEKRKESQVIQQTPPPKVATNKSPKITITKLEISDSEADSDDELMTQYDDPGFDTQKLVDDILSSAEANYSQSTSSSVSSSHRHLSSSLSLLQQSPSTPSIRSSPTSRPSVMQSRYSINSASTNQRSSSLSALNHSPSPVSISRSPSLGRMDAHRGHVTRDTSRSPSPTPQERRVVERGQEYLRYHSQSQYRAESQQPTQLQSQRLPSQVTKPMRSNKRDSDIFVLFHESQVNLLKTRAKDHDFRLVAYPPGTERIWIYETRPVSRVRYMATVSGVKRPGEITNLAGVGNETFNQGLQRNKFAYEILHLYELADPVDWVTLLERHWLEAPPKSYILVPPAPQAQLIANLMCDVHEERRLAGMRDNTRASYDVDDDLDEQPSVSQATSIDPRTDSQQAEAQLQSTMVQFSDAVTATAQQADVNHDTSSPLVDDDHSTSQAQPSTQQDSFKDALQQLPPIKQGIDDHIRPSQATTVDYTQTPSPRKQSSQAIQYAASQQIPQSPLLLRKTTIEDSQFAASQELSYGDVEDREAYVDYIEEEVTVIPDSPVIGPTAASDSDPARWEGTSSDLGREEVPETMFVDTRTPVATTTLKQSLYTRSPSPLINHPQARAPTTMSILRRRNREIEAARQSQQSSRSEQPTYSQHMPYTQYDARSQSTEVRIDSPGAYYRSFPSAIRDPPPCPYVKRRATSSATLPNRQDADAISPTQPQSLITLVASQSSYQLSPSQPHQSTSQQSNNAAHISSSPVATSAFPPATQSLSKQRKSSQKSTWSSTQLPAKPMSTKVVTDADEEAFLSADEDLSHYVGIESSQFQTKSQMLPESLLNDDACAMQAWHGEDWEI